MSAPARVLVSKDLVERLKKLADEHMTNHSLKERWLDQVCTSQASRNAGGVVMLSTDHDWALAYFIWQFGQPLPRNQE